MPFVTVNWLEGRNPEQKKKAAQGITRALSDVGVKPENVSIVFFDVPKTDWVVNNIPASEK